MNTNQDAKLQQKMQYCIFLMFTIEIFFEVLELV
jgi:hypothetical protein